MKKLAAAKRKQEREKKKSEVAARRVIRNAKTDKLVKEGNVVKNKLKKEGYDMAFKTFFSHMARYDKIKRVRKRAVKDRGMKPRVKQIATKPQKPKNPYTDWF